MANSSTGAAMITTSVDSLTLGPAIWSTAKLERDVDDNDNEDAEIGEEEEDRDSDDAELDSPIQKPSKRKQQQHAIFDAWFERKAIALSIEPTRDQQKPEHDDLISLKELMAKQQSQSIIASPREYQYELFERAKQQNTIAVLDTGSGKTLIAVMLLRHVIDEEAERCEQGQEPRISFFLVDKVALVFQQSAVLETNLDAKVARFCGSMGVDQWKKETWDKQFTENRVIVCTAEILIHCLFRSFITIEQINLLIFDEAHHAKKDHVYARIIKEFYLSQPDVQKRPRIFGMTASPVDVNAGDDVLDKAWELEALLHARIATASNLDLLRGCVSRPEEQVLKYDRLPSPTETRLYRELWAKFRDIGDFRTLFDHAKDISSELGTWCADVYWTFAFSERAKTKMDARWERRVAKQKGNDDEKDSEEHIQRLEDAHEYLTTRNHGSPSLLNNDLSSKVIALHKHLALYFSRPSDTRCLVFVDNRYTTRLLKLVFDHIGGIHMRPAYLIGAATATADSLDQTIKQQVVTLHKFRTGEFNCLFATSVAEEGLDIQDCNLVIRFDRCKTMIQYIQSRGRARHRNSKFVHLIEANNVLHAEQLEAIKSSETILRQFCEKLPEDRLLTGNERDPSDVRAKRSDKFYIEKTTGAKLTHDFSLVVLANFANSLPHEGDEDMAPNYVMSFEAGKFICEVILPRQSPISSIIGQSATRKSSAKRSAAFEACIALRKLRHLNEYLLPTYTKQLPAMRNAQLALNSKHPNNFPAKLKPDAWEYNRPGIPDELFVTVLTLSGEWDREFEPLALLTRSPLPDLPIFPIFGIDSKEAFVHVKSTKSAMKVSFETIAELTAFTLVIFKDIFNKTFEHDAKNMPYWLAPLLNPAYEASFPYPSPESLINWDLLFRIRHSDRQQWSEQVPDSELVDRFIIDPYDGARRFFSKRIASGVSPGDPVPADSDPGSQKGSIINYSVSMWKKSAQRRTWNMNQPVIAAERVLHRLNLLAPPSSQEQKSKTQAYICPEPLSLSVLPIPIVVMALTFPAIIFRIESYLVALEFSREVGVEVSPSLALEAVTKDSNHVENQDVEQVDLRKGMGANYERLEFMGDCFLKMATSIAIFVQYAHKDQFHMHCDRMIMLTNRNLLETSCKRNWPKYVRSVGFNRRNWYPEGIKLLQGRGANKKKEEPYQMLSDKTIADVCEALIGAAFVSHYDSGYAPGSQFDNAVKAVTQFVDSEDHKMLKWADYCAAYELPAYQTATARAINLDLAKRVELEHSYKFRYPRLLYSAFQHPSQPMIRDGTPSYERLEFLGDSLLDVAADTHLFFNWPTKGPQWLTEHKEALVSNQFLGALCVKLGFYKHLRYNSAPLPHAIKDYVTEITEAEANSGGARDYWTLVRGPPKCLPDIVEAYVGAMFIDSDFNFAEVQRFFDEHIKWFFEDMTIYDTFASHHPVTKLHHLFGMTLGCSNHTIMSRELPSIDGKAKSSNLAAVIVHDSVVGDGKAEASKMAKIRASQDALRVLEGLPPYEYRLRYGCDCTGETDRAKVQDAEEFGTAI